MVAAGEESKRVSCASFLAPFFASPLWAPLLPLMIGFGRNPAFTTPTDARIMIVWTLQMRRLHLPGNRDVTDVAIQHARAILGKTKESMHAHFLAVLTV